MTTTSALAAPAAAVRTVLLVAPQSLCAGVGRAIEIVERALAVYGRPVFVRKQIVHNTQIVADLAAWGAVFVDDLDVVPTSAVVVLVVGSDNSSNSLRLVEVARRAGVAAYLIDDAAGIDPAWLDGVSTVGLTAGASAPTPLTDEVIAHLATLGPVTVAERATAREDPRVALPAQVRRP